MDEFNEFQDFQDFQDLVQNLDEDGNVDQEPPIRESRILWERNNPLINISDTEFR